eukprot:CAMPEP_0168532734 /NCGR_PEP_ID=MMETSP0405-20121227/16513_1 /TAXON_ID=498012 /ORGANISM="Trichosphaerium sp, Strain Am-I-7 wt" /LENGTH=635 /DNA_ID=CAMNT_0008558371 /DNA_START=165 /DNA_END=2072 /DNA_ORIENTATION=-
MTTFSQQDMHGLGMNPMHQTMDPQQYMLQKQLAAQRGGSPMQMGHQRNYPTFMDMSGGMGAMNAMQAGMGGMNGVGLVKLEGLQGEGGFPDMHQQQQPQHAQSDFEAQHPTQTDNLLVKTLASVQKGRMSLNAHQPSHSGRKYEIRILNIPALVQKIKAKFSGFFEVQVLGAQVTDIAHVVATAMRKERNKEFPLLGARGEPETKKSVATYTFSNMKFPEPTNNSLVYLRFVVKFKDGSEECSECVPLVPVSHFSQLALAETELMFQHKDEISIKDICYCIMQHEKRPWGRQRKRNRSQDLQRHISFSEARALLSKAMQLGDNSAVIKRASFLSFWRGYTQLREKIKEDIQLITLWNAGDIRILSASDASQVISEYPVGHFILRLSTSYFDEKLRTDKGLAPFAVTLKNSRFQVAHMSEPLAVLEAYGLQNAILHNNQLSHFVFRNGATARKEEVFSYKRGETCFEHTHYVHLGPNQQQPSTAYPQQQQQQQQAAGFVKNKRQRTSSMAEQEQERNVLVVSLQREFQHGVQMIGNVIIGENDTVQSLLQHKIPETLGARLGEGFKFGVKYYVHKSERPIPFNMDHLNLKVIRFLFYKCFVIEKIDETNITMYSMYGRVMPDERSAQLVENDKPLW